MAPMPQAAPAQRKNQISMKLKSPWKGINTLDALAEMAPDYALDLQNFIATPLGLNTRPGYQTYTTGFTNPVTSLLVYNARVPANNKMFAVAGGSIYDATPGGAVGTALVTGQSTSAVYWQSATQVSPASQTYLIAVNGTNAPQLYNGSTWTTCSQTGSPTSPGQFSTLDQNGNTVNIADFVDVIVHAQRLWFVCENTTVGYYIGLGAVGGQLEAFDFGSLFPRGGTLAKLASWTIDTGNGIDYILVVTSNKGDVLLYTGNDPSNATTWDLTGVYQLGAPIGQRCTIPLAGDVGYLSRDGLFPLSKYIQSPRVDISSALTDKITPTIQSLFNSYGNIPGWDIVLHPTQKVMLLNVPQATQTANFQFCYDTINMAWTQFSGWPAACFCLFNEQVYFGGPTFVALAFTGFADGANSAGAGGNNIISTGLQAFTDLGITGKKRVTKVKPFIQSGSSNPVISVGVNTDFNLTPINGSATLNPVTGAVWDNATWDNPNATWAGSNVLINQWFTPVCWPGEYVALAVSISATAQTTWAATEWVAVPGAAFP